SSFVVNPNFRLNQNDIALISLATPVTAVTPVTLINTSTPITTPGTTLIMAGYGSYGKGTSCCESTDNKRRRATTGLGAYQPSLFNPSPQPVYQAEFRNPLSPNNPNYFGLTVPVTQLSGMTDQGDSGGPLWIQTAQGLVQIGVVQGGGTFGNTNGVY